LVRKGAIALSISILATGAWLHWSQVLTLSNKATSIIGFIRKAAIRDALVPYGDRADQAMKHILTRQAWTPPQRKWLDRIGKQLRQEYIADRAALDSGAF